MIPSAIKPATLGLVAQRLKQLRHCPPLYCTKINEIFEVRWEHTRRPTFIYGTPLRISKPYNADSGFECSVRKGTILTQLSLVYSAGSNLSQLQFLNTQYNFDTTSTVIL